MKPDWFNFVPEEIKLLFIEEIENNPQCCELDEVPQGIGEFGLEKTNPIPTYGLPENETYLRNLRTSNRELLRYRRTGSFEVENISNPIDEYEIFNAIGDTVAFLYFSPYHKKTSEKSPQGFYLKGEFKRFFLFEKFIPLIKFRQKSAVEEYHQKLEVQVRARLKEEEKRQKEKERLKSDHPTKKDVKQSTKLSNHWEEVQNELKKHGITKLYHFTSRKNLNSIIKNKGLFSWSHCENNGIKINEPGGSQLSRNLDSNKGLEDYVRLGFTRNHPMMFTQPLRSRDNIILEIDLEVLFWQSTLYANINAASNDVVVGDDLKCFQNIDLSLFKHPNHFGIPENKRKYYQAKVLVKNYLPIQFIKNIHNIN